MTAETALRGRRWLMALLVIGYTLNFIDRQIAGILAEPIKHVGEFTATVKLHPEVSANLKVVVERAE